MTSIAAIFLGIGLLWADGGLTEAVRVTKTERVKLAPGGAIKLAASSGDLNVEGWDRPEVEITIVKSTSHGKEDEAKRRLDGVSVASEHPSDTEVSISTSGARHGVTLEYQIRAPRDARLTIQHRGGYVQITDMTGDIDVHAKSGDIMLMVPQPGAYAIDAECEFGGIYSDFAGNSKREHLIGRKFVHDAADPAHRIHLRMGIGGITIVEVPVKP
jgi:hypothetical protein